LPGIRGTLSKLIFSNGSKAVMLALGYIPKYRQHTVDDVDYSKYLGSDWKSKPFKGKRVPSYCGNHETTFDYCLHLASPYMK